MVVKVEPRGGGILVVEGAPRVPAGPSDGRIDTRLAKITEKGAAIEIEGYEHGTPISAPAHLQQGQPSSDVGPCVPSSKCIVT